MVSRDDVSGGAALFQDADCGFGDGVVCNDVAVAGEKDAGLGAVEYMTLTDAGLIALQANAVENDSGGGFVVLDLSIVAVNEDVDLTDASSVAGDLDAVGLRDENVGGNSGACGDGGTRRLSRRLPGMNLGILRFSKSAMRMVPVADSGSLVGI